MGHRALKLYFSAGKVVSYGLEPYFYAVEGALGFTWFWRCHTYIFLQVEDAIQTSPCGEKTAPCVLIVCLFLFCFLCWPLGPYFLRVGGALVGGWFLVLSDFNFCFRATCRWQNLHTSTHTPTPRTGSKLSCSPLIIKSPFPPLPPLAPALKSLSGFSLYKIFTPPSTQALSHRQWFFACVWSLPVIWSSILLPLIPHPPAVIFVCAPPGDVFTLPSTHPTGSEFFCSLPVIKFSLLLPLTPLLPVVIFFAPSQ